jgi:hypothetical protein
MEATDTTKYIIKTYIDDGRVFYYEVNTSNSVLEHSTAIIQYGYRHNDGNVFEYYPPHRILKVTSNNIPTKYIDAVEII